jgi:hypothetical protein
VNIDTVTQQLIQWLETFVEKPHPALGGWSPCPYARQARMTGQIKIVPGTELVDNARQAAAQGLWQREVVIYCYPTDRWSGREFADQVSQINQFLRPQGMFALDDHPDNAEIVNGISFNFGECALMILQLTDKLDTAARALAAKGYYDGWPEEYLAQLFHGRTDPRKI